MALIQFTKNHTDHSTDKGYKFEFFCDRCGNGFMSEFKASAVGMAASALHAAGSFFGGILDRRRPAVMRSNVLCKGRPTMRPSARPRRKPSPISGSVLNARAGFARPLAGTPNARFAMNARRTLKPNWPLRRSRLPWSR